MTVRFRLDLPHFSFLNSTAVIMNGHATNGANTQRPKPLKVLIIGAGIGGLTVALSLRRQGHHSEVREPRAAGI